MVTENIKKACQLARSPGGCKYYDEKGPCCVIANLFVLEQDDTIPEENRSVRFDHPISVKYGWGNLSQLQHFWDSSQKITNEQLLERAEEIWK